MRDTERTTTGVGSVT